MKTASQSKPLAITAWAMQIILAAVFVLMGAFPKLSGDVYSVALFEKLGFEPGRFIVGGAEAIAAVLLLVPGAHAVGGALVVGLMLGAIGSHLENLERNDGYKGFNQHGVSDIISRTDPRKQNPVISA